MSTADAASAAQAGFQRTPILVVAFGHLTLDTYASFLAPFLPLVIDKFSLSMTMAGLLAVFLRVPSVLNPFLGSLADRWDLRWAFVLAPFVAGVCMSAMGLASNYTVLCLLLLATGLCSSVYHVLGPAVIASSSGSRLGRGMGYWMTSGELARTVGPLLAVAAIAWFSFEQAAVLAVLGLVVSIFLHRRLGSVDSRVAGGRRYTLRQVWGRMRHVMRPVIFLLISRGLVLPVLISFLPVYLVSEGMGAARAGMWLVGLELFGVAGAFFGGALSDRLGRRRVLAVGLGVSPLAMLAFVHGPVALRYGMVAVLGLSVFSTSSVLLALIQDHARQYRSTATGFYMGTVFGIAALTILLAGWLADMVGFDAALTICAVGAMLCLPALFFLPAEA